MQELVRPVDGRLTVQSALDRRMKALVEVRQTVYSHMAQAATVAAER
jgi:hypothetical protein